jgi:hypothetical protein
MQRNKNFRLATPGFTTVLLSGLAFAAGADQMMRAMPGDAPAMAAKPVVVAPAIPSGTPATSIATPRTLLPEIVADGGGLTIGGQPVAFTNSNPVSIRSTTMMPTAASPSACRFVGSFQLKNTGAGVAPTFDVQTMADSQQGVRSMKTGYMIPGMLPGASYPENFYLDLAPGIYSVILVIDPEKKLQQSAQNPKKYLVKINANCGPAPLGGGVQKKRFP